MKTKVVDGLERKIDQKKYLGFTIQLGLRQRGTFLHLKQKTDIYSYARALSYTSI